LVPDLNQKYERRFKVFDPEKQSMYGIYNLFQGILKGEVSMYH
jgi:hypothetical protein